jgi:hypothetical protein
MDTDKLNRWMTFFANVGVLAGIFLVAYEVRQTNVALDREYDAFWTEVQGRSREGWREFNSRIINSDEVADIWTRGNAGKPLTPLDAVRYRYLANDNILLYQQMFDQWEVAGRDTGGLLQWLESSLERNPGLQKELTRIVVTNPGSRFAETIRAEFPQLLRAGDD